MSKCYGRLAPDPRKPRLKLSNFLDVSALTVPVMQGWTSHVKNWPIYLNDRLGDCTVAAVVHNIQSVTAEASHHESRVSDAQVLAAYKAVSGYNGHASTDNGAVMQDVMNYWRKIGVGGHRIVAFAELDPQNRSELQAAIYLFDCVHLGVNITDTDENLFDRRHIWNSTGGHTVGGHAIPFMKYDHEGAVCATWGMLQRATWGWISARAEEAWVPITQEWLNKAYTAPNGLHIDALNAQYTALTGNVGPFK